MSKDNGGSAFPNIDRSTSSVSRLGGSAAGYGGGSYPATERGMTLRDYFAAKAMQTILQSNAPWPLPDDLSQWAAKSYQIADSMLEERKR